MSKKTLKFLEFNGKVIMFMAIDGTWWVALKPICEALGVNWDRQYKNLKKHRILNQLYADQPMVAADGKTRKMISLPEFMIYGWIFNIESNAEGMEQYQLECYQVLYEHFHGAIGGRKDLLKEKARAAVKINKLLTAEQVLTFEQEKRRINAINIKLRKMDDDIMEEEKTLFDT